MEDIVIRLKKKNGILTRPMALTAAKEILSLRKKLEDFQRIGKEQREHIERLNTLLASYKQSMEHYKDQTERLSLDLGLK